MRNWQRNFYKRFRTSAYNFVQTNTIYSIVVEGQNNDIEDRVNQFLRTLKINQVIRIEYHHQTEDTGLEYTASSQGVIRGKRLWYNCTIYYKI